MLKSIRNINRRLDEMVAGSSIAQKGFVVIFLFNIVFLVGPLLIACLHFGSLVLTGESAVAPLYPFLR